MKEFTEQEIKKLSEDYGWSEDQVRKGYEMFACYGSDSVIEGAIIVEEIGDINKFNSDWDACRQAEKDGVKFINDIDGLEKGCYVDTPDNRKHCIEMLEKYPEYRVENLIKNSGDYCDYWDKYKKYFEN